MNLTTLLTIGLAMVAGAVTPAAAQVAIAPPPPPDAVMLSAADLDQMLGPIALYPDPLIAQILPAATQPSEVVMADRYLAAGYGLDVIDQQPWDASVKALARFPDVLKMMDDDLPWTTALGQAFLNQPDDVMDSIQRLRAQAQALGNLESTPQAQVVDDDGLIDIVPADPGVIYVPVYQPTLVFIQRPVRPGYFFTFRNGRAIGAWFNHDFDWRQHRVIVWSRDHPRPADWWQPRPATHAAPSAAMGAGRPRTGIQNATVWRPRPPSPVAAVPEDRGWGAPSSAPAVHGGTHSARPAATAEPPAQRPTAGGALIGARSTRETREYSSRGEQSRQAIAEPSRSGQPSGPPPPSRESPPSQRGNRDDSTGWSPKGKGTRP